MKVRVVKDIRYAGRSYRAGDVLEMTDSHANTFERIRKVTIEKEEPVSQRAKPTSTAEQRPKPYKRRDMVAEQLQRPPAPEPEPEPPPPPSPADEALHEPALQPPEESLDLPPLPKKEMD